MEAIVLLARLALAVTFVVSASAKLRDREGARQAVADFGAPKSLVDVTAWSLAPLELASAALLLTTDVGVVAGALIGAGMLLAFTIAIVVNLQRGNRVDCHCFGALSTKPLSWRSVARNAALLVLAGLVLFGGASQPWPWVAVADLFAPLTTSETWLWALVLVLVAAVAVLGYLFFTVLRQYGHVLVRLEGIESAGHLGHAHGHGSDFSARPAPEVALVDSADASLTLADVVADDRAALFVFVSPSCAACGELVDELRAWQADDDGPTVVVVSPGDRAAITEKFGDLRVLAHDAAMIDDYGMEYTPGALVVSTDHLITTPPSYGSDDVRRLYSVLSGRVPPADVVIGPPPVREGDPLPQAFVTVGDSSMLVADAVASTVGTDDAVLLFWDTTCGFCQQITTEIARRVGTVPMLVMLRDGNVEGLAASGITAPVALDPAFAVGNALEAPGTPCAVRVRDGVLASTVAVGGPEVLNLLAAVRVSP